VVLTKSTTIAGNMADYSNPFDDEGTGDPFQVTNRRLQSYPPALFSPSLPAPPPLGDSKKEKGVPPSCRATLTPSSSFNPPRSFLTDLNARTRSILPCLSTLRPLWTLHNPKTTITLLLLLPLILPLLLVTTRRTNNSKAARQLAW